MLEQIITYISSLNPFLIFVALFFFAFIENIFPPSPSDIIVVVGATVIADSAILFIPILAATSIASSSGFILMYYIGKKLGDKVIRTGKFKFLKQESLDKADRWFSKYGYGLIFINRFLPGTRAVVSFFSGLHRLHPVKTFMLATISSFLWYALLIYLGIQLEKNVHALDQYLKTYRNIILVVTFLVLVFLFVRYLINKRRNVNR